MTATSTSDLSAMGNVMNDNKRNIRSERSVPARHRLCAGMLTALAALGASAPAYAQRSDTPQSYSIQAGSLGDALNQLARQSKLQIVYSPELVRGKTASAISGQLTWRAALERLLAGSDLEWRVINDATIVIKKRRTEERREGKEGVRRCRSSG